MEDGNDMLIYTPADRLKIMSDGKMCVCKEIYRWEGAHWKKDNDVDR